MSLWEYAKVYGNMPSLVTIWSQIHALFSLGIQSGGGLNSPQTSLYVWTIFTG